MYQFPIGVMLDSFRLPIEQAMKKAYELGAEGFQLYTTSGEFAPENMTDKKIADFKSLAESYNLKISALCGDMGMGFWQPLKNPELIERSEKIVDLCVKLESSVVTTHIGVVPADKNHPRYKIMYDAVSRLAEYADSKGVTFAIETGPETAEVLRAFLDDIGRGGIGVNLDPANLVMVTGDDPVKAVDTLAPYIVHTHAKDGIKLDDVPPEIIYGIEQTDIPQNEAFREVALGTGSVDFPECLKSLDRIGYRGFLTIEREVGDDPTADIKTAVDFLKKLEK